MLVPKFTMITDQQKSPPGFTLIELVVVIAIISFILGIAVVNYQSANKRARDGRRKADLEQIRSAAELYRANNPPTGYPANLAALNPNYLNPLSQDPFSAQGYIYYYNRTGSVTYNLCGYLEAKAATDPNCPVTVSCGTPGNCNYGLTQP